MNTKDKITELLISTKRLGIKKLAKWLEDSDFFTAPASSRLDFHGCYKGGLAKHSYNVFKLLEEKNERFNLNLPRESIIIAAILHDLCKVGCYSENFLKNGQQSETKLYKFDDENPLGHGSKSLYLAGQFIKLTKTEALMIRWHMGGFDYEYKLNADAIREIAPAVTAIQCADMEASAYVDDKG